MRCKNCGKEIEEYEIFCDDCKEILKKVSSKSDVNELERLIENQKKLNDLENTKELVDLSSLAEESMEQVSSETEEKLSRTQIYKDLDSSINEKETNSKAIEEPMEKLDEEKTPKNNKKKLIIIISSVVALLIIIIVVTLLLLNKNNSKEKEVVIDYEKVINEYGNSTKRVVSNYLKDNEEVPTWQKVSELINYKKYEVVCDTHNIYSDGNIYLSSCKVDGKKVKYTYGTIQEEVKEGKKITIYNNGGTYNTNNGVELGTITCETDSCEHISSYQTYSLIKENDKHYIYNYETNTKELGPFNLDKELVLNNKLYAVIYKEDNTNYMYSFISSKTLKNISGTLDLGVGNELSIMYKYGYAVFKVNNKFNFVNLKTGNVSYSIVANSLAIFKEDTKNNLAYIISYTNNNKIKLYNSNGKALLNEEQFNTFKEYNSNYVFIADTNYKICDSNLNIKTNSKKYDKILGVYEDFIVVLNKNHLEIVDTNDKVLATFEDEWKNSYEFKEDLSGWATHEDNYGIYLTVQNKSVTSGTLGYVRKYYYIKDSKETGMFETNTLN